MKKYTHVDPFRTFVNSEMCNVYHVFWVDLITRTLTLEPHTACRKGAGDG